MVHGHAVVPARAVAPGKVALDHVVGQERAGPSPEVVLGLVVDRGKVEVVGLNRVVDRGVVQTSGVVLGPVVDQGKEVVVDLNRGKWFRLLARSFIFTVARGVTE